ncbi:MDR family MFS transporter [Rhizomicrobium electricum]|uniref:MDR family MFS transporter n=2 Tax=Rhizomicrobium electricum TaxID=480070 RepID=A0ABN1E909_9PROT
MFMAILDVQVVATSLPTIQGALGIARDKISWIQTAYLIAEVIAIPLTGFLTRLLTMRWLFVVTISVFTAASIGCAASTSFSMLMVWRVVQGFSGGTLIPAVFTAVFLLFPPRLQGIATTIGGVLAVLAPTVGPIVGGWITETYTWHWLFLINVVPGIGAALGAVWLLPVEKPMLGEARSLDVVSIAGMAVALAALEIALKEAPDRGWLSPTVIGLLIVSVVAGVAFARRTLGRRRPVVELRTLTDPMFAVGSLLSFVLGIGLFGSVYMMPVFLGFARGHEALEIGEIMLVTGIAQLATAPLAVALERRMGARLLTTAGFALFAIGLGLSAFQTPETDFAGMFWPQVIRGVAIMFCLLPPTRLALGHLDAAAVPDASGLFNLMRNLGGAIGIALIDSIIYGRAPGHAQAIVHRLMAGDVATAKFVGIPLRLFAERAPGPIDAVTQSILEPMVNRAAFVAAMNDAWAVVAILTLAALLSIPFARQRKRSSRP